MGQAHIMLEEYKEGKEYMDSIIIDNEGDSDALYWRAVVFGKRGEWWDAYKDMTLALDHSDSPLHFRYHAGFR